MGNPSSFYPNLPSSCLKPFLSPGHAESVPFTLTAPFRYRHSPLSPSLLQPPSDPFRCSPLSPPVLQPPLDPLYTFPSVPFTLTAPFRPSSGVPLCPFHPYSPLWTPLMHSPPCSSHSCSQHFLPSAVPGGAASPGGRGAPPVPSGAAAEGAHHRPGERHSHGGGR